MFLDLCWSNCSFLLGPRTSGALFLTWTIMLLCFITPGASCLDVCWCWITILHPWLSNLGLTWPLVLTLPCPKLQNCLAWRLSFLMVSAWNSRRVGRVFPAYNAATARPFHKQQALVLNQGRFCPLGDIWCYPELVLWVCYWYLVGRGQGMVLNIL